MKKFQTPFEVLEKVNPVVVGIGLEKLQQEKIEMLEKFAAQFIPGYLAVNYVIDVSGMPDIETEWALLYEARVLMYKTKETGIISICDEDVIFDLLSWTFDLISENNLNLKP